MVETSEPLEGKNEVKESLTRLPDPAALGRRLGDAIIKATYPPAPLRIVDAGFTVGDFLKALRELGIRDSDLLTSIEYGIAQAGTGELCVERDLAGAITVHEVTRKDGR